MQCKMRFHHALKHVYIVKQKMRMMELKESIEAFFSDIPLVEAVKVEAEVMPSDEVGSQVVDAEVMLVMASGNQLRLFLEFKSKGEPRLARDAVNQLKRFVESYPDVYPVFVAPYISPASAELCRNEDVGYIDFAGNGCLCYGDLYIERTGKPNPFRTSRSLKSMYQPRSSRVLRVLLAHSLRLWKQKELKEEAQVSLGQVNNVVKLLWEREWVEKESAGLRLIAPEKLLTDWSKNYTVEKNERFDFYSLLPLPELEERLAGYCLETKMRFAFTCFSAAARLAPTVRYKRVTAYVGSDISRLSARLELKSVTTGANVILMRPYDDGVFYGIGLSEEPVVCPPQLYLDLLQEAGRGEDAAKAVLNVMRETLWPEISQ